MKRVIPLFALLLASHLAHADDSITSEVRNVSAFRGIELAGTLEVDVTIGAPARVEITGEASLLDRVTTTVRDGVLVIDTKESRSRWRSNHLHAIVSAPDLASLAISGTGSLRVTGIANQALALDVSGTGELRLSGSTGALHVAIGGTGEVAAKELVARDATVEVSGTGSAVVRASQSLDATVSGTGSINVVGHPARVRKSVTGLGSIHVQ